MHGDSAAHCAVSDLRRTLAGRVPAHFILPGAGIPLQQSFGMKRVPMRLVSRLLICAQIKVWMTLAEICPGKVGPRVILQLIARQSIQQMANRSEPDVGKAVGAGVTINAIAASLIGFICTKSKRVFWSSTSEPRCCTCSPSTSRKALCIRCVALWLRTVFVDNSTTPVTFSTGADAMPPPPPTSISAWWTGQVAPGLSLGVRWAASAAGTNTVDSYDVRVIWQDGDNPGGTYDQVVSGQTQTAYFAVDNTSNWSIQVRAHDAAGWGAWSTSIVIGGV